MLQPGTLPEVTLDMDIAKKAAETVKSLFEDGYIIEGIDDHQQLFQSGKAAFATCGSAFKAIPALSRMSVL